MKSANQYIIKCTDKTIYFQKRIKNFESDTIYQALIRNPTIKRVIEKVVSPNYNPLGMKAIGYFPNIKAFSRELYSNAKDMLRNEFSSSYISCIVFENKTTIESRAISLLPFLLQIIDSRHNDEISEIDIAKMILKTLRNFLKQGHWYCEMRLVEKSKITKFRCVSKKCSLIHKCYACKNNEIAFFKSERKGAYYLPFIWFGLPNMPPIDCWTLSTTADKFNKVKLILDSCSERLQRIEKWKFFWFCSFWSINWNELFDHKENGLITKMFSEYAFDEPQKEFEQVRNNCPIELNEEDDSTSVIEKIARFFMLLERFDVQYNWNMGGIIFAATMNHRQYRRYFRKEILQEAFNSGYWIAEHIIDEDYLEEISGEIKTKRELLEYLLENIPDPDQLYEYLNGDWMIDGIYLSEPVEDDEVNLKLYAGAEKYIREYIKRIGELPFINQDI